MSERLWEIPEGLRVLPDGSWRVGDLPVQHGASLDYFKTHLVLDDDGAYVVQGPRRMRVEVDGPLFEVVSLALDAARGQARVALDDGSEEALGPGSLEMNERSGRFEAVVRGGRARAVFSRAAHQTLLDHAEQEGGAFFLRVGSAQLEIRT